MSVWLFQYGDKYAHAYPDDDSITEALCGHDLEDSCDHCGHDRPVVHAHNHLVCHTCKNIDDSNKQIEGILKWHGEIPIGYKHT